MSMKNLLFIFFSSLIFFPAPAQFVARMEVKEDIPGLCDRNNVYALFPSLKGQKEAICPVTMEEILNRLDSGVQFVKDHPGYNDKGMIGMVISCKGELVQCKMDNHTQNPELDKQIETVFKSLGTWKAGKLNGKDVDTSRLFSFEIMDGKFKI